MAINVFVLVNFGQMIFEVIWCKFVDFESNKFTNFVTRGRLVKLAGALAVFVDFFKTKVTFDLDAGISLNGLRTYGLFEDLALEHGLFDGTAGDESLENFDNFSF